MSVPFLIAHKVRGEVAFDIAEKHPCPTCIDIKDDPALYDVVCNECEGEGYWWICSTSGHRAYPYWHMELSYVYGHANLNYIPSMPEGIPDHYRVNASPRAKVADIGRNLLASLGLTKPSTPIKRRI